MVGGGYTFIGEVLKRETDSPAPRKREVRGARGEFFGRQSDKTERIKALVDKLKSKTH